VAELEELLKGRFAYERLSGDPVKLQDSIRQLAEVCRDGDHIVDGCGPHGGMKRPSRHRYTAISEPVIQKLAEEGNPAAQHVIKVACELCNAIPGAHFYKVRVIVYWDERGDGWMEFHPDSWGIKGARCC
jgi:hypothetical protein